MSLVFVCVVFYIFFFFFSSRRRHTRFDCDWSSDVCSSDLCLPRSRLAPSATGVGRDRVTLELTGCGDLPWVTFPRPQESREDRRCDVQVARPLGEDTQGSEARNTPSRLVAPPVS